MESDRQPPVDFSIVIPVYCNEGSLHSMVETIESEVLGVFPGRSCEIVFVDDGSTDASRRELLEIRARCPDLVKIVALTRNFGQPAARLAGLATARGRCVITISADGQDPPALMVDMLKGHLDEGHEIVIAVRKEREEPWSRIIASKIFFGLIRMLSFPNMPLGGFDYVLMGRRSLDVLLKNQDAHPFFQGQVLWTGFPPKFLEYKRMERKVGRSRWTLAKKFTKLIDGVASYSYAPIRFISLGGVAVAVAGLLYAAFIVIRRVLLGTAFPGWAGLMAAVLVTSGIQMLMLGVIGEYLWRALEQARNRDRYVIDRVYEKSDGA